MSDKPVSWQYIEGVAALIRLVELIKNSLDELESEGKLSKPQISQGQSWAGCYFLSADGQNKFWFGQPFDGDYGRLLFSVEELKTWSPPPKGFELYPAWKKASRVFNFADHLFFSRDTDGQKNEIKQFIIETLSLFIPIEG